jgi:hypothetical protein
VPVVLKRRPGAALSGIAPPVRPLAFEQVRAKFEMVSSMVSWVDSTCQNPEKSRCRYPDLLIVAGSDAGSAGTVGA